MKHDILAAERERELHNLGPGPGCAPERTTGFGPLGSFPLVRILFLIFAIYIFIRLSSKLAHEESNAKSLTASVIKTLAGSITPLGPITLCPCSIHFLISCLSVCARRVCQAEHNCIMWLMWHGNICLRQWCKTIHVGHDRRGSTARRHEE